MCSNKVLLLFVCIFSNILIWTKAKDVCYEFTANYSCGAPDGVSRCTMLVVNNEFPGPSINATIGDTLIVKVHNAIDPDIAGPLGTTIHWHGLLQMGTPFEDGAEMINQCPIPYNHTQIYKFELKQWGTYWWHAHAHWQYTDGFWGTLIIHNNPEVYKGDYDDELVITLSDWYHKSGPDNTKIFLSPVSFGVPPLPDSVLMNGRGCYVCDPANETGVTVFNVTRGKRYRIRIINTSAITTFRFSIDDHELEVIETDGVDTIKKSFSSIPISAAQRYSAIVRMNGTADEYWINARVITPGSLFLPLQMSTDYNVTLAEKEEEMLKVIQTRLPTLVQGVFRFVGEQRSFKKTISKLKAVDDDSSDNEIRLEGENTLQPYDQIFAPTEFDEEIKLTTDFMLDNNLIWRQTFDKINYQPGTEPILSSVLLNRTIPQNAHAFYTGYKKVIQLVINNPEAFPHPIHLHGHHFWVVGAGVRGDGNYDPDKHVLTLNGVKRDTVSVLSLSYLVLRFISDNPGVWYIHCHINWHLQAGMAAVIIEAPEKIKELFQVTPEARRICHLNGIHI